MLECVKCGRRHYGINGRDVCSSCFGQKKREPKIKCKECGRSCLNSNNEGICGVCRGLNKYREANIPNARRCEVCGKILRTKKECITVCTRRECGGVNQYYKTIRASHKHNHPELECQMVEEPSREEQASLCVEI